jgi:hypothetical protein
MTNSRMERVLNSVGLGSVTEWPGMLRRRLQLYRGIRCNVPLLIPPVLQVLLLFGIVILTTKMDVDYTPSSGVFT